MQSCERASLVCSNYFQTRTRSRARDRRACVTNSSIVEAIRNSIITAVLELDRARDLPWNLTEGSWRRRPRSFLESFSVHTSIGESSPSAGGSPSVPSARCVRGARGMTDPRPSWLTCRSTTADSRTGSARPADRVFSRTGSPSPSRNQRPPSRLADSFVARASMRAMPDLLRAHLPQYWPSSSSVSLRTASPWEARARRGSRRMRPEMGKRQSCPFTRSRIIDRCFNVDRCASSTCSFLLATSPGFTPTSGPSIT